MRLGSNKDFEEVKSHAWFKDLDWDALIGQKLQAPYDPKITDANWIQNFDEDFLSQDSTLRSPVRDSAVYDVEKDNLEIEDAFKGFDE